MLYARAVRDYIILFSLVVIYYNYYFIMLANNYIIPTPVSKNHQIIQIKILAEFHTCVAVTKAINGSNCTSILFPFLTTLTKKVIQGN